MEWNATIGELFFPIPYSLLSFLFFLFFGEGKEDLGIEMLMLRVGIVDTCMGCKMFDIDASPSLFKKVAPDGDGRVKGIDWGGPAVGG